MSLKQKIPGIVVGGLALWALAVIFNEIGESDKAELKQKALCEEFSDAHKNWVKDNANPDWHGQSVFKHPAGHICRVYPSP